MTVKTLQALAPTFTTSDPTTGAAMDATGMPAGALYKNGAATADVVTVTKPAGVGIYKAAVTLPALVAGDAVAIHITATVNAVNGGGIVFEDVADTKLVSDISGEAAAALVAVNLDHLVGTATGIPALPAGTFLDLRTLPSASYALEATLTKIKKWLQLLFRKDAAIATDNAIELAEINANMGTGVGAFANITDSVEAIRDRGDAAWITGTGLDAAGMRGALGMAAANLDTQLGAIAADICDCAAIDAQLSGTHGAGPWGASIGVFSVVYTATVGGVPTDGVYCRMTTDIAGLINVDAGFTNALGQVIFHHNLPSGTTVYIWRTKSGVTFVDPDVEVIP